MEDGGIPQTRSVGRDGLIAVPHLGICSSLLFLSFALGDIGSSSLLVKDETFGGEGNADSWGLMACYLPRGFRGSVYFKTSIRYPPSPTSVALLLTLGNPLPTV